MNKNTKRVLSAITVASLSVTSFTGNIQNVVNAKEDKQEENALSTNRVNAEVLENEAGAVIRVSASSNVQNNNNNNSTQQNVQNAKSQQEIRSIVAQAISTPEQNINFVKIKPEYEDDYAMQNNGVPLYIYEVEARANGLEYDVVVDAVSGKVLKVEIDN